MIHFLILLMSGNTEYGAWHAHQDSMFIHKAYKQAAEILEKTSQPERWSVVDDSVSKITAGAFIRLNKYNHKSYESVEDLNKEGVGATFVYPEPSEYVEATLPVLKAAEPTTLITKAAQPKPDIVAYFEKPAQQPKPKELGRSEIKTQQTADTKEIAFKVLDRQTRFLVDERGKTIAPYLVMNYYAKGRILVKSEKLNPVTLEPIQTKEQVAVATSE